MFDHCGSIRATRIEKSQPVSKVLTVVNKTIQKNVQLGIMMLYGIHSPIQCIFLL